MTKRVGVGGAYCKGTFCAWPARVRVLLAMHAGVAHQVPKVSLDVNSHSF